MTSFTTHGRLVNFPPNGWLLILNNNYVNAQLLRNFCSLYKGFRFQHDVSVTHWGNYLLILFIPAQVGQINELSRSPLHLHVHLG
ncbi:hypothetical protein HOLleu_19736 [Holothuria leucospilota]|uniref:Uncharacterized protein n=1 Tax=Holothuria leucospilota TaxID=206669 RepID=A0A9Q1BYT4_HOLLE|nr:hypothetical protein HOLleu_19736 [Holothuria leucospilota]